MNRERAETHLRFVAEAELRRATAPRRDGAAMPPALPGAEGRAVVLRRSAVAAALYDLPIRQREVIALQYYGSLPEAETATAMHITRGAVHAFTAHGVSALRAALETGTSSRVARVAQVLTAVRALDREVADQILDDFALALGTRRAGTAGQQGLDPRSLLPSSAAHLPLGMLMRSRPSAASRRAAAGSFATAAGVGQGPARSPAAVGRVIPLGQVIPVRGGEVSGEMHLLSYAQTASGARLTVITRARGEFVPPGIEHGMEQLIAVFPVHQFSVKDDHGTSYRMGFRGRRGRRPDELAGEVTLDPGLPSGIGWLELTTVPGGGQIESARLEVCSAALADTRRSPCSVSIPPAYRPLCAPSTGHPVTVPVKSGMDYPVGSGGRFRPPFRGIRTVHAGSIAAQSRPCWRWPACARRG